MVAEFIMDAQIKRTSKLITVSERNLYACLFGVKNPIAHVMGYFVSVLRERIANFEAPEGSKAGPGDTDSALAGTAIAGISINDLRKNLRNLNEHMDAECASSAERTTRMPRPPPP